MGLLRICTRDLHRPALALIAALLLCPAAHSAATDTQADAGYMLDDNVTRAKQGGSNLTDRSYSINLSRPAIFPLDERARAVLTGSLGGEQFARHHGLNRFTGAVQGELQYRGSAEFSSPVFALYAKISAEQYRSDLRDGFRYAAGISLRQALTDRIRIFGAVTRNRRDGNHAVFDNRDNSARIHLDYSPGNRATVYLGGEYRRGDIVISGSPLWSSFNPNAYTPDDAFSGGAIYSYRFDGTTLLTTLGWNMALGPRDAIDISWKRARSSVEYVTSSWSKSTLGYLTNQYALAYLVRF
ncbi:MAG: hypothetical protein HY938_11245 [Nitrosomonadales bacterium]|nr:hypothetical protein [Nitrosomonadales bacterium]